MTGVVPSIIDVPPAPPVSLYASHVPIASLSGLAFFTSPPDILTSELGFDFIVLSPRYGIFIGEMKASAGSYPTLPPTIAMSHQVEDINLDLVASRHRHQELESRRTHEQSLRTFAGQWVVLERDKIVTHGHDPVQVVREARQKGIQVPYIFYVETPAEEVVKMGL